MPLKGVISKELRKTIVCFSKKSQGILTTISCQFFLGFISSMMESYGGSIQDEVVSLHVLGWNILILQILMSHAVRVVICWIVMSCTIMDWHTVISSIVVGGRIYFRDSWLSQRATKEN